MNNGPVILTRRDEASIFATNTVLRNTYLLLSLSLFFAAGLAWFSMVTHAPYPGPFLVIAGFYGLLFLISALRNSAMGILAVFAFTGFIGYTTGPLLNAVISTFSNGSEIVVASLGGTGAIFLALSAYALTTKKDFSYMIGFMVSLSIVAIIGVLASLFLNFPILHCLISGVFVLLASITILIQTSLIVNGGETNYIMATVNIFVSLYNLFISLIQLLSAFSGNSRD